MKNNTLILFLLVLGAVFILPIDLCGINKYSVYVNQPDPIRKPIIKWVTVSNDNKNEIAWQKQVNDNIVYYNIYRNASDNDINWELAGTVNYNSETYLSDLNSFANIQSYKYKIAAVDKCGNETFSNTIVRSIYLSIKNSDGLNSLQWTSYEGVNLNSYHILKGTTPNNLVIADSINAMTTNYVDNNTSSAIYYYQVEANGFVQDSTSQQVNKISMVKAISNNVKSVSNIVSNTYDSILNPFENKNLIIYPNPLKTTSIVKFPFDSSQQYQLIILDLLGNIIKQSTINSSEFLIKNENFAEGIYILKILGHRSIQQKLIVGDKGL